MTMQLDFGFCHPNLIPGQSSHVDAGFLEALYCGSDPEWIDHRRTWPDSPNGDKVILSLFDYSGVWSHPYHEAGYPVLHMDIKLGQDVRDFDMEYLLNDWGLGEVYGILAAVPCTEFAVSGARWFNEKDADGRTEQAIHLVNQTLRTIELFNPVFFAIENPVGRMRNLVPELDVLPFYFNPCDYAQGRPDERYTKKTGLWGVFTPPTIENVGEDRSEPPVLGSKMHKLYGGKSERTKELRSQTPTGFARAFFECNQ